MGFFSGGQFNLVVSFRYVPAAGELSFWCQMLGQASNILFDATDGAHSIGQVLISPNSMGGGRRYLGSPQFRCLAEFHVRASLVPHGIPGRFAGLHDVGHHPSA
jgi:hypothetical protein